MNFTRRLAEDARKNSSDPRIRADADAYCRNADRSAQSRIEKRKRVKERHVEITKPEVERDNERRATDDAKVKAETADLRQRALARSGGVGELCGEPFLSFERPEMAHLCGGSGKRRQEQSIETVLMEHHRCHQGPGGLDKDPLAWSGAIRSWAKRHGYPVPKRWLKLEAFAAARRSGAEGERDPKENGR